MNAGLPALRSFVLPGGSEINAVLHVCRTVCRRAERLCVTLAREESAPEYAVPYLNRLSDAFFVWSRWATVQLGAPRSCGGRTTRRQAVLEDEMRTLFTIGVIALALSGCDRGPTGWSRNVPFAPSAAPVYIARRTTIVRRHRRPGSACRRYHPFRAPGPRATAIPFFNDPMLRDFFGLGRGRMAQPRDEVQRGLGSGVVVSEDGYILTNHHVIDGAQEIKVEVSEGKVQRPSLSGAIRRAISRS